MNSRALNSRREPGESFRGEGQPPFEGDGKPRLIGRQECEGDLRGVAFLVPEAGPEGRVYDRLDCLYIGVRRQVLAAAIALLCQMTAKMPVNSARHSSGGGGTPWCHG